MSGITPLIDTLMHQVLGRHAESSLQRPLNAPVQPVPPGEGPRALQGDASLDGRPLSLPLGDLKRLPTSPDGQRLTPQQGDNTTAPGSTQTHLSPAARTIADVLLRFPAPPAVMRPEAPLMSTQDGPSAATLATRLEASVRDSGLFYESHLKRWFQGEVSRQQLLREPQMQHGPRPLPTPAVVTATAFPATLAASPLTPAVATNHSILPGTTLLPVGSDTPALVRPTVLPTNSPSNSGGVPPERQEAVQARNEVANLRELADQPVSRSGREIVHESLQSLVRQQLDMLVTPTIRWEGDVWAGIFMALVINLPSRDEGAEKESGDAGADEEWRTEMQLEVPNLGAFSISLRLYQAVLSIDLASEKLATHQQLEDGAGALEQRLSALDFRKVLVRARYIATEEPYGDFG